MPSLKAAILSRSSGAARARASRRRSDAAVSSFDPDSAWGLADAPVFPGLPAVSVAGRALGGFALRGSAASWALSGPHPAVPGAVARRRAGGSALAGSSDGACGVVGAPRGCRGSSATLAAGVARPPAAFGGCNSICTGCDRDRRSTAASATTAAPAAAARASSAIGHALRRSICNPGCGSAGDNSAGVGAGSSNGVSRADIGATASSGAVAGGATSGFVIVPPRASARASSVIDVSAPSPSWPTKISESSSTNAVAVAGRSAGSTARARAKRPSSSPGRSTHSSVTEGRGPLSTRPNSWGRALSPSRRDSVKARSRRPLEWRAHARLSVRSSYTITPRA